MLTDTVAGANLITDLTPGSAVYYDYHPTMKDAVSATYPIQQTGFSANSVDTSITDYRATRLTNNAVHPDSTMTEWEFNLGGDSFYFQTDNNGLIGPSANVLDSSLNTIDIWLPPHHTGQMRTRQFVNGWSEWIGPTNFTALGYINSYDKYQILNRATITIG